MTGTNEKRWGGGNRGGAPFFGKKSKKIGKENDAKKKEDRIEGSGRDRNSVQKEKEIGEKRRVL